MRFVETTEAKIFRAAPLLENQRELSVKEAVEKKNVISVNETLVPGALVGRSLLVDGKCVRVLSNDASSVTVSVNVTAAAGDALYHGEGGAEGGAVYGCLFIGKGAYGVIDLSEGTEVIVKPRGSAGTADPLDQRSTVGWKGVHAAAILYDEYMLRVECGSSYSDEDEAN